MNTLKHCGAMSVLIAAATSLPLAAAPAPSASAAAPDGYATKAKSVGKTKADAMAQEDERMSKCKAMKGDEKKGCEAHAKAIADETLKNAAPTGGEAPKK
jgi:hypothetical protein